MLITTRLGAGDGSQLRALVTLAEDPGSAPIITWWLTTAYNFRARDPTPSSEHLRHPERKCVRQTCMQANTHTHKKKNLSKGKGKAERSHSPRYRFIYSST